MNTLVIVVIAACCLAAGYLLYGRWLAHKWGIDPNAKTPAVTKEDGQDYVPTDGWVVFAHQFSSIAGAGPVTGAIQAAVFGWVRSFSGSSSAASSSALLPILVPCTPALKMKANRWDF